MTSHRLPAQLDHKAGPAERERTVRFQRCVSSGRQCDTPGYEFVCVCVCVRRDTNGRTIKIKERDILVK